MVVRKRTSILLSEAAVQSATRVKIPLATEAPSKRPYRMQARAQAAAATGERILDAADAFETRLLEKERPQQLPSRPDQAASTGS
jgi:hypothetical protein